jgi:hypothetical protein
MRVKHGIVAVRESLRVEEHSRLPAARGKKEPAFRQLADAEDALDLARAGVFATADFQIVDAMVNRPQIRGDRLPILVALLRNIHHGIAGFSARVPTCPDPIASGLKMTIGESAGTRAQ